MIDFGGNGAYAAPEYHIEKMLNYSHGLPIEIIAPIDKTHRLDENPIKAGDGAQRKGPEVSKIEHEGKGVQKVKKAIAIVILALLAVLAAVNVTSACFLNWYQPELPKK